MIPPARSHPKSCRRERIDNLCESQYADPAHADIKHRRKPFRTGDPADFYDNADQCDCPDKSEQEISDRTFQNDQADWCVASGDQYKDHHMVDLFQDRVDTFGRSKVW